MAEAVTELTGVSINRDHKSGGSGMIGMTAYMAAPTDGTVLEHIDDATSAIQDDSASTSWQGFNSASNCSSNIFTNLYKIQWNKVSDWPSFVKWVKAQDGKATIANVSKEGSMERVTMKFITDASNMSIQISLIRCPSLWPIAWRSS